MIGEKTKAVEAFWQQCRKAHGISTNDYHATTFADPRYSNYHDMLLDLVAEGKKRATAHMQLDFEKNRVRRRVVGDYWVILSTKNEPRYLVRVTDVTVTPFNEVKVEFASREGEGDSSLRYWAEGAPRVFYPAMQGLGRALAREPSDGLRGLRAGGDGGEVAAARRRSEGTLTPAPMISRARRSRPAMPRSPARSSRAVAEHGLRIRPEEGRRRSVGDGRFRQSQRARDGRERPRERMVELDQHAAMADLGIRPDLRQIVDRAAGHVGGLERLDPIGASVARARMRAISGTSVAAVHDARRIGLEAGFGGEFGQPAAWQKLANWRRCRRRG